MKRPLCGTYSTRFPLRRVSAADRVAWALDRVAAAAQLVADYPESPVFRSALRARLREWDDAKAQGP